MDNRIFNFCIVKNFQIFMDISSNFILPFISIIMSINFNKIKLLEFLLKNFFVN